MVFGRRVKLRYRWAGPLPQPGEFLRSCGRARNAYEVLTVREIEPDRGVFTCAVWPVQDVPAAATVHGWKWDRR